MDLLHTFINMYNTVKMSNVPLNVKTSKYINVFPAHSEVYGQGSTACTGERRAEKGPESCNCQAILNQLVQVRLCLFKYDIKYYCAMMTIHFIADMQCGRTP